MAVYLLANEIVKNGNKIFVSLQVGIANEIGGKEGNPLKFCCDFYVTNI